MTFRAHRIVENADWRTGAPAVVEDMTAEVLARPRDPGLRISKTTGGKMTAETANSLNAFSRAPKQHTRDGDMYDETRARNYCLAMTGQQPIGIIRATKPVHGEKKPRICALRLEHGIWPVPHWDWNGHNESAVALLDREAA